MKKDIESKEDIILLVNSFYERIKADDTIGYIFNDIVKVNWEKHLPVMYSFWENSLFYTGSYEGNPMELHKHLHRVTHLTKEHFKQWAFLFSNTVDGLFEGKTANLAKQRAISIATVMEVKILASHSDIDKIF